MDRERYQQVKELFDRACELDAPARCKLLDEACADDDALRSEVESLLSHIHGDGHPLDTPIGRSGLLNAVATASEVADEANPLPAEIGGYRIIRRLGEGGMGVVYEAEQDSPRRRVALKTIHEACVSRSLDKRFEHEIQILGNLQHEGIARIYDAGLARDGRRNLRFFTMELIEGESITRDAESRELGTRQRLKLLSLVCDAVHYAHRKGVIHRDLKPANILVDAAGRPKILDFGVARVTDADIRLTTIRTDVGQLIGTLPYMSPEQVAGDAGDLDVRSDVYSLGVLLYELLTGRLPHDLTNRSVPEAARIIREEDPVRLSSVARSFRGDLDTIVHKSLERDRERRYQSASAMSEDIRHYLQSEPIAARPPTATYHLRKFAKRHMGLVAGLASAFAAMVFGTVGIGWFAWQTSIERDAAQHARDDAEIEAARATQVVEMLEDMLEGVGPAVARGRDTTLLREILDGTAERIEQELVDQPEVNATIRDIIGLTYQSLDLFEKAESHLQAALRLRRDVLGDDHPTTLESLNALAVLYLEWYRFEKAEPLLVETLERRRKILGEEHGYTLGAMNNLANLYRRQGRYEEAEPLYLKALALGPRVLGEEHAFTQNFIGNLAILYYRQERYDEAEPLYVRVLDSRRRTLGGSHPSTLNAMNNLGDFYRAAGRFEEARPLLEQTLKLRRHVLGAEHSGTQTTMNNLAILHRQQGRYEEAERLAAPLLEIRRRTLGETHQRTLTAMHNLGYLYLEQDKLAEAEPLLRTALERSREVLGEEHPTTQSRLFAVARLHTRLANYGEAEKLLRQADALFASDDPKLAERRKLAGYFADLYAAWGKDEEERKWRDSDRHGEGSPSH